MGMGAVESPTPIAWGICFCLVRNHWVLALLPPLLDWPHSRTNTRELHQYLRLIGAGRSWYEVVPHYVALRQFDEEEDLEEPVWCLVDYLVKSSTCWCDVCCVGMGHQGAAANSMLRDGLICQNGRVLEAL
jgi:hypothetical protein